MLRCEAMSDATDRDIQEQDERIRKLQRDVLLLGWDALKRQQEVRFGPITLVASAIAATAALFGAAFARQLMG